MKTKPVCHLSADSERRYARHLVLPEIGQAGQEKLLASSALVIGAGGLGSAALAAMCASGIGRLGIVEFDRVELSNLQRQVLFEEADIGRPKIDAARDRLEEINPACMVETFSERLGDNNARALIKKYDVVIDGSDNFATRFALADACYHEKKTLISAAISGFDAQLSSFRPGGPCYRCLVSEMPERERDCAQEGIVGPLAGMMGHMQALEAIRELLGIGSLSGSLLVFDARTMEMKKLSLTRDPACKLCGAH